MIAFIIEKNGRGGCIVCAAGEDTRGFRTIDRAHNEHQSASVADALEKAAHDVRRTAGRPCWRHCPWCAMDAAGDDAAARHAAFHAARARANRE